VNRPVFLAASAILVLTAAGCASGEGPAASRPDAAVAVDVECRRQPSGALEGCKVVRDTAPECGYAARALAGGNLVRTDGSPPQTLRHGPYLNDPVELRDSPTVTVRLAFPACRPVPLDPAVPKG
jgi:hypothetical protein